MNPTIRSQSVLGRKKPSESKMGQIFDTIEIRLNDQAKMLGGINLTIPLVLINAIKK